jgi:hypothetical protein
MLPPVQPNGDSPVPTNGQDSAATAPPPKSLREHWREGPKLPRSLGQAKRWLSAHHMTLVAIADTPHSIAFGSAIGIFFGFTPLASLKTLLSIGAAWLCRCNKIAAVVAVTLHDVLIFAMPAIYFAEYKLGCWMLGRPPAARVHFGHFRLSDYVHWHIFGRVIWPALIGSLFLAVPTALATYFLLRMLVRRARSCAQRDSTA